MRVFVFNQLHCISFNSLEVQKWRLLSPGPRPTTKPMKDNLFRGFNCRIWLTNYDPTRLERSVGATTSSSFWHPLPLALWKLVLSFVCFCFVFIIFFVVGRVIFEKEGERSRRFPFPPLLSTTTKPNSLPVLYLLGF
jgi:hypothetical protein